MANPDKPLFSEKQRSRNPILRAEDTNGFFQADRRQRLVHGTKFNHLFGGSVNEYGEQKATLGDFFRSISKPKKMIRSDNEELYLTGLSGRDILEARYLQLASTTRQAPIVISIAMALAGIIIAIFLEWSLISTWLMAISYVLLCREIVVDVSFTGPTTAGSTGSSELQKWRQKKTATDQLSQLMLDLLKIAGVGVIVFFVFGIGMVLIGICTVVIGELYFPLYEDFISLHLEYWKLSNLTYFPQLVISTVLIFMTIILILSRGFRHERAIRSSLKTFEEGRREYDRYMMCGVIKDLPDAIQWVRFYYDRAPTPTYDYHVGPGREPEAPAKIIPGFDPGNRGYEDL